LWNWHVRHFILHHPKKHYGIGPVVDFIKVGHKAQSVEQNYNQSWVEIQQVKPKVQMCLVPNHSFIWGKRIGSQRKFQENVLLSRVELKKLLVY
jgi:hypothetical protein